MGTERNPDRTACHKGNEIILFVFLLSFSFAPEVELELLQKLGEFGIHEQQFCCILHYKCNADIYMCMCVCTVIHVTDFSVRNLLKW